MWINKQYYTSHIPPCIGPPVIGRTIVQEQTNHMVLQCGVYYTITVSPKDAYGNLARVNKDLVFMTVKKV